MSLKQAKLLLTGSSVRVGRLRRLTAFLFYLAGSSGAQITTYRVEPTATAPEGAVSNAYEIHRPNSAPMRWESFGWSHGNATISLRFLGPPELVISSMMNPIIVLAAAALEATANGSRH
jgi:hypothetical protein